jgi:hypothetical protein
MMGRVDSYYGKEAVARFWTCINSYLQDDATGSVYGVWRDLKSDLVMAEMSQFRFQAIVQNFGKEMERLKDYEMIVIDSGNTSGDSWVATFYPRQIVCTFVNQA